MMHILKRAVLCILTVLLPVQAHAMEWSTIKNTVWENTDAIIDGYTAVTFLYDLSHPPLLNKLTQRQLKNIEKMSYLKTALFLPIAVFIRAQVYPRLTLNRSHGWAKLVAVFLALCLCSIPETRALDALKDIWHVSGEQDKRKRLRKKKRKRAERKKRAEDKKGPIQNKTLFSSIAN